VTNAISSLKLNNLDKVAADAAVDTITDAGGKAEIHIIATSLDIARGWGRRHSVAEDFLYDDPVQLGSLRIGPDLADVGARQPDANWQLVHLYAPQSVVKDSAMPPFRYLFHVRKINGDPSPDAQRSQPGNLRRAQFGKHPIERGIVGFGHRRTRSIHAALTSIPFT